MVDLQSLRRTIESAPPGGTAAIVTRPWLEQIERDLRELADRRAKEAR